MIGSLKGRPSRLAERLAPAPAEIVFVAYAADCWLQGTLRLRTGRLSDFLNREPEISLTEVTATSLVGGPPIHLPEVTLWRDCLYVVHLAGPRGDRSQKRSTIPRLLGLKVGPYLVGGRVHVAVGADPDPVVAFERGRHMVPLTDAWVGIDEIGGGAPVRVPALVVNRSLCDWVVPVQELDDLHVPEPAPSVA